MKHVQYVCGLLFTQAEDGAEQVLLIHKARPARQAGKLNGVGGKIEEGETPLQAMEREFKEETGLEGLHWEVVGTLPNPAWSVYFYGARTTRDIAYGARTVTDEALEWVDVARIGDVATVESLPEMLSNARLLWSVSDGRVLELGDGRLREPAPGPC